MKINRQKREKRSSRSHNCGSWWSIQNKRKIYSQSNRCHAKKGRYYALKYSAAHTFRTSKEGLNFKTNFKNAIFEPPILEESSLIGFELLKGSFDLIYKKEKDPNAVPLHEPIEDPVLERGDRGGKHAGMSGMHKTRSVDYGFVAKGARSLVLDDLELSMESGDICVQLGNYHAWANRTDNSLMGYVMIGADFKK